MFGMVSPDFQALSDEQKRLYRTFYCGVCESLRAQAGIRGRLTLNYDLTFLALLLDPDAPEKTFRCPLHPLTRASCRCGEAVEYAAAMNLLLTRGHFEDDWLDDGNLLARGGLALFSDAFRRAAERYEEQNAAIRASLTLLGEDERRGETNPELPSRHFGQVLGTIFAWRADETQPLRRAFGEALGQAIYIMDACIDRPADLKRQRYNPLSCVERADFDALVYDLLAEVCSRYERWKSVRSLNEPHAAVIENILYSGISARYELEKCRNRKATTCKAPTKS